MATSTWSYRQSTNLTSSSGDADGAAAVQSKLEQARRQRTGFYRRLAEAGARVQPADDDVEVDAEASTRRQRLDASSPYAEVVSSVSATNSSLMEKFPEPRSSWRYYTSYDNGEWRRHATPIYHADAELESGVSGKLSDRRSASMTTGLTTHDDLIDIEDNEDASSSHSRPTSGHTRQPRLRGSACLTRQPRKSATSPATDSGPTTLEEVKMVMKDVFDRSRYGSGYDVSELVQKILGERLRHPDQSPPQTEERVIYANPDRQSILDNVTQPLRPTLVAEIPEGSDEKEFVEKTLAPSGRRWTSSPPPDSQQIVVVRSVFDDDDGLRYEDIGAAAAGARVAGTSLENWRDSSCRSPSNVPDTLNGEEARWTGAKGRTVVTSETTRHHERQTAAEAPTSTSMSSSRTDAFGRRIPADAVEVKVQVGRAEEHRDPPKSRPDDERNSTTEQWLRSGSEKTSSAGRQHGFVGGYAVEKDEKRGERGGALRHDGQVEDVGMTARTSNGDGRSSTKSTGKTATVDGRIWIPVIHVAGSPAAKKEAPRSDASPLHSVETKMQIRSDGTVTRSPVSDGRRQVGSSPRPVVDNLADSPRQDHSGTAASTRQSADEAASVTSSLRTGSGVGSYGFRSSIVVDRDSAHGTRQMSTSRSSDVVQSAGDGGWVVEKAL